MKYLEVKFVVSPCNEAINDILEAQLAEIGFDSFVGNEQGTLGYIQQSLFDSKVLSNLVQDFPLEAEITYSVKELEDKNWNEEWEKNYFSPIVVDNRCIVKSTFHKDAGEYEYTIIINPKMAFGTGHHQTTILMMEEILKRDFSGQSVLDMGCGTAILAVLASMRGAKDVVAIDIDEWAYDNAIENLQLNSINNVEVLIGGAELLADKKFDTVLANINRNILLQDMAAYSKTLSKGGTLYMSGFYTEDIKVLEEEAAKQGLELTYHSKKDNWAVMKLIKL